MKSDIFGVKDIKPVRMSLPLFFGFILCLPSDPVDSYFLLTLNLEVRLSGVCLPVINMAFHFNHVLNHFIWNELRIAEVTLAETV